MPTILNSRTARLKPAPFCLCKTMQPYAERFYKGPQWQAVREIVIKRDQYLCQDCKTAGRITPAEEVHHIIELTPENIYNPEIALGLNNLISLCRECHKARHAGGRPVRRYKVDELGRVEII